MDKISKKKVAAIFISLTSLASYNALAQTSFDMQGLTVGMNVDKFSEAAKILSSNSQISERIVVMETPRGIQLEEIARLTSISFATVDGGNYTALAASQPLEEKIYSIRRKIQYGTSRDDPSNLTSLDLFEEALFEKYGEPINQENSNLSSRNKINYIFSNSALTDDCSAEILARANLSSSDAIHCPPILHVELMYINQPNNPVTNASLTMNDYAMMNLIH